MSRSSDSDPLLGRVLDGKFTLLSVLGRGGMGVVYRAHQASLERSVALKLMMGVDEVAADSGEEGDGDARRNRDAAERASEFQRRFFLEAATAAKLKHPNTITVFDYGSTVVDVNGDDERVFYITMELLDGITLSKLMAKEGPIPPLRAVRIALQMCRSLKEAHAAGIVHRDLKPGNVMLVASDDDDDGAGDDFVKVLDFGLAKTRLGDKSRGPQLTKAGTFLGSPRYVAPEQIEGKPVDGRADIYSFGCVLYRMLTGRVPFDGQQAVEVMLKHLHDPVPPLSTSELQVPKALEELVLKCLQKKAADRPANMDEVINALKKARVDLGARSGNVVVPDDLKARLAAELAEGAPSLPSGQVPLPLTTKKESTSPSQAAPGKAKPVQRDSSSQPSLNTPISQAGPLSISGEWKIGPAPSSLTSLALEESTRPTHARNTLTTVPARRTPVGAIAFGVVVGLVLAGVAIAGRLGKLDPVVDMVVEAVEPPSPTTTRPPGPVATQAAKAVLRVTTDPVGADVFDVTPGADGASGVPRLLGITPLVVPWTIAVGDPSKELVLKLPGHVTARARVEPPPPSQSGDAVTLDVGATLRPSPR